MKMLTLALMLSTALTAFAREEKSIELDCFGEIRYNSYSDESVSLKFETLLTVELAKKNVGIGFNPYINGKVVCDYRFDPKTFYALFHKADMELTFTSKKSGKTLTKKFRCNALVQDGGNQTLKKSCAKKTASKIREMLDQSI